MSQDMIGAADLSSLVARIVQGDGEAEALLVKHFAPRVKAMAIARTRNPELARDLTQETLMAVLTAARRDQVKDPARIAAFVHGVSRNVINNHLRRQTDHPEAQFDEDEDGPKGVARLAAVEYDDTAEERKRLLGRALEALSAPDRQVLMLTLVEGLTPAEIGTRIGVSSETIRTRKSRALKRVMDELALLSRKVRSYHLVNE
jgi:RNA polymerase sigma-70 factor (ECF subfamily)